MERNKTENETNFETKQIEAVPTAFGSVHLQFKFHIKIEISILSQIGLQVQFQHRTKFLFRCQFQFPGLLREVHRALA